jgi:acyl carrier protein
MISFIHIAIKTRLIHTNLFGWDLDPVDITLDLKDEFDIEISDEEAEKMVTVDAAIDVVQANLES